MKHRALALFICAFALSGCGSATDAVTFAAPPGYKPDVSVGPFMQMWSGPNHNAIMLIALPTKLDLTKPIKEAPVENEQVTQDRQITICDGQLARIGSMHGQPPGQGSKEDPQDIEFVATGVSGKTYMALYTRPVGAPVDRSAEAAIRNVCPKRS